MVNINDTVIYSGSNKLQVFLVKMGFLLVNKTIRNGIQLNKINNS